MRVAAACIDAGSKSSALPYSPTSWVVAIYLLNSRPCFDPRSSPCRAWRRLPLRQPYSAAAAAAFHDLRRSGLRPLSAQDRRPLHRGQMRHRFAGFAFDGRHQELGGCIGVDDVQRIRPRLRRSGASMTSARPVSRGRVGRGCRLARVRAAARTRSGRRGTQTDRRVRADAAAGGADSRSQACIVELPIAAGLACVLAFRPRRRGTPERQMPVIQTQDPVLAMVGAVVDAGRGHQSGASVRHRRRRRIGQVPGQDRRSEGCRRHAVDARGRTRLRCRTVAAGSVRDRVHPGAPLGRRVVRAKGVTALHVEGEGQGRRGDQAEAGHAAGALITSTPSSAARHRKSSTTKCGCRATRKTDRLSERL